MSLRKTNYTIKELPLEDRPREKLISYGESKLSNSELIAILLGSGTRGRTAIELAQDILCQSSGLIGLADLSIDELTQKKGIGQSKASRLKVAFELGRRLSDFSPAKKTILRSPIHAVDYMQSRLKLKKQEIFLVVLLDIKSQVIKVEEISKGGLAKSIVHPREVFKTAIRASAAGIILGHNHPSGNTTASSEDINITNKLIEAGNIIGIKVIDHLIIGDNSYLSMREEGLINC
ncbi:DNA repair protein RadC [Halanaerobiaceae bacterium Z-7014]|uniref:DNA repair protein RadC n=1 Tax=Halonatronomonas betaini TaxID=2778430 RepID=A0A931ASE3_9FIRM|nr:DNA repair protein RadC [Halonatronomonas betaini]